MAIEPAHPWRSARHKIRQSRAYRTVTLPLRLGAILAQRHSYDQVIVHNAKFTRGMPPSLLVPLFCRPNRGRFTKPASLTILLAHNRPAKTLMELSLDYLGIHDYTVLRMPADVPWRHTARIPVMLDWLTSGACTTEYVLFSDCDDALMRDDPQKAIDLLQAAGCQMLVSSTAYDAYHGMPDVKVKTESFAPPGRTKTNRPRIHLNAGVYIARAGFLREYLEAARQYVTDDDLSIETLNVISDKDLLRLLPEFPCGVGSDQTIMRYLFPRFHPRMKIDYDERLARR